MRVVIACRHVPPRSAMTNEFLTTLVPGCRLALCRTCAQNLRRQLDTYAAVQAGRTPANEETHATA